MNQNHPGARYPGRQGQMPQQDPYYQEQGGYNGPANPPFEPIRNDGGQYRQGYGQPQGGQYRQNPGQRGPRGQRGFAPKPGRKPGGMPLILQQTINDFRELFRAYFSMQPVNAYRFDLSPLTWSLLLALNVLFFGFARATAFSRWYGSLMGSLSNFLGDNAGVGKIWGSAFGLSLLGQIVFLVVILGLMFLTSFLAGCEKRPPLQFVKTLATSSMLHTLLSFLLIFISIPFPMLGLNLLVMSSYFFIFVLALGFTKLHPSRNKAEFWFFALMFLLVAFLHTVMPGISIINSMGL